MKSLLLLIEQVANRTNEATAMMELACNEIKSLREENEILKVEIRNLKAKTIFKVHEENLALAQQVHRYEKLIQNIQTQIKGGLGIEDFITNEKSNAEILHREITKNEHYENQLR